MEVAEIGVPYPSQMSVVPIKLKLTASIGFTVMAVVLWQGPFPTKTV